MFKIFEKGRTLYGGTEHFMGGFDNLLETMEQLLKKIVLPSRRGGGGGTMMAFDEVCI